ncbi:tagaturonate reductase [Cohnella faecalis]|uniref:Tagaturonate reductase n=1 Tax=Cohnella faecalis TaxID=2315694 RepID=A0A398CUQ3_9BACL|nr:tagaturonate reductase [Cohnella faecalis]
MSASSVRQAEAGCFSASGRIVHVGYSGLENGETVERKEVVNVFRELVDPYSEWKRFVALAENPDLRVIVSNTTEAGLKFRSEALAEGKPLESFPGKIAYLLYRRYAAFQGSTEKGLLLLPCELLERNGDELLACVLRHAEEWRLPGEFSEWVRTSNRFLNSLVDRIVTGYPGDEQAQSWSGEWGYEDSEMNTAEPYHLWAIEAEPELDNVLPLRQAGLNVHWTRDLRPYQQRKVRILNGAHTLMTPLGILSGLTHVRELMEHSELGSFVVRTVENEIVPSLPYPREEMDDYAAAVFERFRNPFIRHRLSDIAMNSISKFKTRLLPTLAHYGKQHKPIPDGLARAFAALLRYYNVRATGNGFIGKTFAGAEYAVRDDESLIGLFEEIWTDAERLKQPPIRIAERFLRLEAAWGIDLAKVDGLAAGIAAQWTKMGGAATYE